MCSIGPTWRHFFPVMCEEVSESSLSRRGRCWLELPGTSNRPEWTCCHKWRRLDVLLLNPRQISCALYRHLKTRLRNSFISNSDHYSAISTACVATRIWRQIWL